MANIIRAPHPYGPERKPFRGTRHFGPGAKVYCGRSMWGDGYFRIAVLGKHRDGGRFHSVIMNRNLVENFRLEKVYRTGVLNAMKDSRHIWWGNSDEDRDEILGYLSWLKDWD